MSCHNIANYNQTVFIQYSSSPDSLTILIIIFSAIICVIFILKYGKNHKKEIDQLRKGQEEAAYIHFVHLLNNIYPWHQAVAKSRSQSVLWPATFHKHRGFGGFKRF